MDIVKIGKCISDARKRSKLTQEELAIKVGVSLQAVSKWENGHNLPDIDNLKIIYILFVINTGISYFYSYKRNLIIADQNRYIATIYRYLFYFILNVVQIIWLIVFKNYIGFLILQILNTLLENIFISKKANKMYPFLEQKESIQLDKETKREIVKNTKSLENFSNMLYNSSIFNR